jgi:hypothetical protein
VHQQIFVYRTTESLYGMTHLNLEQTQSIEAENLSPSREAQRPGGQERDHDGEQAAPYVLRFLPS